MKKLKNCLILNVLMVAVMLTCFGVNAFPYTIYNGSGIVFPGLGNGTSSPSSFIENDIVNGAGYFLESYANTLSFMKKIELSEIYGVNNNELNFALDKAIYNMKLAKETYAKLCKEVENIPYNTAVLDSLKQFDYYAFQKEIAGDKEIFTDARVYLYNGDIRGIYARMLSNTEQIMGILMRIKEKIPGGVTHMIPDVYLVNRTFSQSLLFGQYVSQVFGRIIGYY
jgi:hypothetical protein